MAKFVSYRNTVTMINFQDYTYIIIESCVEIIGWSVFIESHVCDLLLALMCIMTMKFCLNSVVIYICKVDKTGLKGALA